MKDKSKKIPKQVYLSPEEFEALQSLSADLGLSGSGYLKMLLHRAMKEEKSSRGKDGG